VSELAWHKVFGIPLIPYLKHVVIGMPPTVEGLSKLLVGTCTILPLIGTPLALEGRNGKWALDGALSAGYAIPDDQDLSRVVRVTPWPVMPSDICMPFMPWFHLWNCVFPPDAKRHLELFQVGYKCAMEKHDMFIAKGLKPLKPSTTNGSASSRINGLAKYKREFERSAALATKEKSFSRASVSHAWGMDRFASQTESRSSKLTNARMSSRGLRSLNADSKSSVTEDDSPPPTPTFS